MCCEAACCKPPQPARQPPPSTTGLHTQVTHTDAGGVRHVAQCNTRLPGGKKQRPAGGGRMHAESQRKAREAGRPTGARLALLRLAGVVAGLQACRTSHPMIRTHSHTRHTTPPSTPPPTHGARHERPTHTALKYWVGLQVSWQLSARQRDRLAGAHSRGVHAQRAAHTHTQQAEQQLLCCTT